MKKITNEEKLQAIKDHALKITKELIEQITLNDDSMETIDVRCPKEIEGIMDIVYEHITGIVSKLGMETDITKYEDIVH